MRTVTYGAACSLDLFIAARDGAIDWLHSSKDVTEHMTRFWPTIDTIVMGRKTFDVALTMQGGDGSKGSKRSASKRSASKRSASKSVNPYGDLRSVVFSRTLD